MTTWARIAAPLADAALLPAWFVAAMMAPAEGGDGRRRGFGLLLATGDVLRVASLAAAHLSSEGTVLLDVVLDRAGVPDEVDAAWRSKHYLGAPVSGAVRATVNLAQVVAAVAFAPEPGERPERANDDRTVAAAEAETGGVAAAVEGLRQAAEDAASRGATIGRRDVTLDEAPAWLGEAA